MRNIQLHSKFLSSCSPGFTMVELLVGLVLSVTLLAAASTDFLQSERRGFDQRIKNRTQEEARAIYDIISYDLRNVGTGVGVDQDDFNATALADDAPLPILVGASATDITFRMNETGKSTVLTTDFTPTTFSSTFDVFDETLFSQGDTIYISNATRDGTAGLKGVIGSISGDTLTLDIGFVATPGVVFEKGSTIQKVSEIRYFQSGSDGVARQRGTEISYLGPNSAFSLQYLDGSGSTLTIPLTQSQIEGNLTTINLSVIVVSSQRLSSGDYHTTNINQRVLLRNLVLPRS